MLNANEPAEESSFSRRREHTMSYEGIRMPMELDERAQEVLGLSLRSRIGAGS
jgi:hypothetical protein